MIKHNDIKIFFVDLDGTLLDVKVNNTWNISNKNIETIKKIKSNGVEVVVSTGRFDNSVSQILELTGIKYAVTGNGSRIIDDEGNTLKEVPLDNSYLEDLISFVMKKKLMIVVNSGKTIHGVRNSLIKWVSKKLGFKVQKKYDFIKSERSFKFIVWILRKNKAKKIKKEMESLFPNIRISVVGRALEITDINASKGLGNKYVAETFYNISNKNEMAHIGDSLNDLSTVEYMNTIIAMENSDKFFAKEANCKGPNFRNGGVAKVLDGSYIRFNINEDEVFEEEDESTRVLSIKEDIVDDAVENIEDPTDDNLI